MFTFFLLYGFLGPKKTCVPCLTLLPGLGHTCCITNRRKFSNNLLLWSKRFPFVLLHGSALDSVQSNSGWVALAQLTCEAKINLGADLECYTWAVRRGEDDLGMVTNLYELLVAARLLKECWCVSHTCTYTHTHSPVWNKNGWSKKDSLWYRRGERQCMRTWPLGQWNPNHCNGFRLIKTCIHTCCPSYLKHLKGQIRFLLGF